MGESNLYDMKIDADEVGARKRVFIPGYSGFVHRMQDTMAGTFATCSRDSHYLAYKGNHPAMKTPTLSNPDEYYARKPNPRYKTNCNNRSTFTFGDDRDWNFDTINSLHFRIPVKIPPRHQSIMPGGVGAVSCTKPQLDKAYNDSMKKVGVQGVKRLELSIRMKIDQRTSGGPMALRKAFKYFDADASGDIDPDEFFAAMHAFGLEFTEDQVLALFGYYDTDRDGGLSYYEFIDKVLDSGFGNENDVKIQSVSMMPAEVADVPMKSILSLEDLNKEHTREIFSHFDANNSGEIDMRELGILIKSLGLNMGQDDINGAMIDLDKDKNGAISFDEFWNWFQAAAVVKHKPGSPLKMGTVNLKNTIKNKTDAANREFEAKMSEDHDAEINVINSTMRPSTASSKRNNKVGSWMSRNQDARNPNQVLQDARNSPSVHLAGRIRPQTALETRITPQPGSRPQTAESRSSASHYHLSSKPAFGSEGWRSVSRSDFRPHNSRMTPPRLSLPPRRRDRPQTAQPLIREPGTPYAPVGSTSGFRL